MAAVVSFADRRKTTNSSAVDGGGIPSLESVSPEYAALRARRSELQAERNNVRTKLDELAVASAKRAVANGQPSNDRVAALAGLPTPPPQDDSAELYNNLADLDEALEIIDRKLVDARMVASTIIRERIAPRYGEIIGEIVDRLLVLRDVQMEYDALTDALNAADVAWSALGPMPLFRMLGVPRDREGVVAAYVREAAERGYFPKSRVPEDLR